MFGKAHKHIYFFALLALVIALPTSKAAVNVMGGVIFVNWLLQWDWKRKWELLLGAKPVLLFGLFFLALAYGFVATDDVGASFRAWVSKIPFLLPIVIATTERPTLQRQRFLLWAFSITVTIASLLSIIVMTANGYQDIREGGLFISHIRFSICAVISILIDFYCFQQHAASEQYAGRTSKLFCWSALAMMLWKTIYLFIIQVFTGIVLLLLFAVVLFVSYLFKAHNPLLRRWVLVGTCALALLITADFAYVTYRYFHYDAEQESSLPACTAVGNAYVHDLTSYVENGNKVGLYVCQKELQEGWSERSAVSYDSVSETLIRYLNSKGQTKDLAGISSLTDEEVVRIENGMANVDYAQKIGLRKMLYPTFFSFTLYGRNGMVCNSSVLQRVELWKNSWQAFLEKPWTGYGLGRNKSALNRQLDRIDSPLRRDMGCHNQFLSYLLMGGVPLLLVFLFFYASPVLFVKRSRTLFYLLIWIALLLSFLAEDTLETGTGLYIFIFFNAFILYGSSEELL